MSRPWPHPKTGVFYLRMRVPADVVPIVGKAVEKVSLGTKNVGEAKRRHAQKLAELMERWDGYRQGYRATITPREAAVIAGEFYRSKVKDYGDGRLSSFANMSAAVVVNAYVEEPENPVHFQQFRNMFGEEIDDYLWNKGILVGRRMRAVIQVRVATAISEAISHSVKLLDGDFSPDPKALKYPLPPPPESKAPIPDFLPMDDWLKKWAVGLSPATYKRWQPLIRTLMAQAGHNDLASVTESDVQAWVETLEENGLAPRTIREANLAACRSLFTFVIGKGKLKINPAAGLVVKVPKKVKLRNKSFSEAEAKKILAATLAPTPDRMSKDQAAARRWVPWICAYSGARVNEITQLRGKDVQEIEGVWAFHITPEAGTVKNKEFRDVPIHEHLIAQGFLGFVKKAGTGPLFFDPKRSRGGSDANPINNKTAERLAAWVREIGVTDLGVQPNHGWRHLFKTLGRRHGMERDVLNAIQGHAPEDVAGDYGEVEIAVKATELARLPRFEIDIESVPKVAIGTKRPSRRNAPKKAKATRAE